MSIPYRHRRTLKRVGTLLSILFLVLVVTWLCWIVWLQRYVVYTDKGAELNFALSSYELSGKEDDIIADLIETCAPDTIGVEKNIALIAVVGRGMKNAKGTAAALFEALAKADINIKMIDQGSSELNIIVGVDNKDFEKAITETYKYFEENKLI